MRHGQSAANVTGARIYDPPLTAAGTAQARCLAAALRGERLTQVVSSPLGRALKTALPMAAAAGLRVRACKDLAEFNRWDAYKGSPRSELARRFPDVELEAQMPESGWAYPGPEPEAGAWRRAERVLAWVAALPDGCRLALVAHGTFNSMLLTAWLGGRRDGRVAFAQDNGCINELVLESGGVTLRRVNDRSHLDPD